MHTVIFHRGQVVTKILAVTSRVTPNWLTGQAETIPLTVTTVSRIFDCLRRYV